MTIWFFQQHAKRAVLEDMRAVGKDAGLKSFEQVRLPRTVLDLSYPPLKKNPYLTDSPSSSFR